MKKYVLIFLTLGHILYAQLIDTADKDSLVAWSSVFLKPETPDEEKAQSNTKFTNLLSTLLQSSHEYLIEDFTYLKGISVLTSPDKNYRIYTWFNLTKQGYKTYGVVHTYMRNRKKNIVEILKDDSDDMRSPMYKSLDASSWFGVVYYDMQTFTYKGKKYQILLGYDGHDGLSQKKVIEVVQFGTNGKIRFGAPIFWNEKKSYYRILFEYSASAKVLLRFDDKNNRYIFDHLAPLRPELEGQFQYYVPDLSYDAFQLKSGKWEYKGPVDLLNPDENLGNQGNRFVIQGVNDENTLKKKTEEKEKK